jgi:hypothetical protein
MPPARTRRPGPAGQDPPATPGQIAGAATNNFAVSDLPACGYTVTLETQVLLTTGDSAPGPLTDYVSFCKR